MTHEILRALHAYASDVMQALAHFFPRLIAAIVVLLLGFLIAFAARFVTRRLLSWFHFNQLLDRTGARQALRRVYVGEPDRLLSSLVFWFTWIVLLLIAARTLGVREVDTLAGSFVHYLPKLVSAALILVIGVFVSTIAWRTSLLAAVNAGIPAAKLIASGVRAGTLVAAIAMALEQLEIGRQVILTAFAITFGAIMLALAIAFGLGGRDLAQRYLEERLRAQDRASKPHDEPSHL